MRFAMMRAGVLLATGLVLGLSTPAGAAFHGRLPVTPGGADYQAYYDDQLDVTWTANANLAVTDTFGLPVEVSLGTHPSDGSGLNGLIRTNGWMNWPGALHWIDAMNGANYLGSNGWRLATMDVNGDGVVHYIIINPQCTAGNVAGCPDNEYGYMYWVSGVSASTPTPFANIQADGYWSGTQYVNSPSSYAWDLRFSDGDQGWSVKDGNFYAWAVRPGDIALSSPVPMLSPLGLGILAAALLSVSVSRRVRRS